LGPRLYLGISGSSRNAVEEMQETRGALELLGQLAVGKRWHGARRPSPIIWVPSVIVAIAMVLPLVYLIERAVDGGLNSLDLLIRMRTVAILVRSVLLVIVVTAASALIAVPLAWFTVRTDMPMRRILSVLTVLPLVIPSYVGGFLVVSALGPRGMLQGLLEQLVGIERLPDIAGLHGAALTITLLSFPYVMLSVRAALWGMDPVLEESARSLGVGKWKTVWRVTLPQLRPAIATGSLLVALYTLSDFGAVSLLRYETFTWAIFLQYEAAFDRTLAAALSLVLVGGAFSLILIESRARGRARYYRSTVGTVRPSAVVSLGRWRWIAFGVTATIVVLSLVAPISVLSYWVVRGMSVGEPFSLLWQPALNSIYSSALAAMVASMAAVPVVILIVRHPGRWSGLVEKMSFTGFALPGIVVALALIFFGSRYATPFYQTMYLLVFAYVVLFLPQAISTTRAAFLQVSPHLAEAARSLGYNPTRVLIRIALPLMVPGILSGGTLVFLTAMKELPATMLLSPIGFSTLATSIWAAAEEAFFAQSAVPALLLVIVSAIPTSFLILREPRGAH